MAKLTGWACMVTMGSVDIDPSQMKSIETNYAGDESESTGMGDPWDTFESDIARGCTVSIEGWDIAGGTPPANSLRKALTDAMAVDSVTVKIYPSDDTMGNRMIQFDMLLDEWTEEFSLSDTSPITASGTATGEVLPNGTAS